MKVEDVSLFADHVEIRLEEHAKRNGNDLQVAFATGEVARLLETWIRKMDVKCGPLFQSSTGKPLTRTDVGRIVKRWAGWTWLMDDPKAAPVTPHCARRTYTTMLRTAGCPDHIIARLRGDTESTRFAMVSHCTDVSEKALLGAYLQYFSTIGISAR